MPHTKLRNMRLHNLEQKYNKPHIIPYHCNILGDNPSMQDHNCMRNMGRNIVGSTL